MWQNNYKGDNGIRNKGHRSEFCAHLGFLYSPRFQHRIYIQTILPLLTV